MGTALLRDWDDYREGAASLRLGDGFFQPGSRVARDLTVLLCALRGEENPIRMLDLMTGCGIRALRCGLEAPACLKEIWANDADEDRLPLTQRNLLLLQEGWLKAHPERRLRCTALSAKDLLAQCHLERQRFDLIDFDAFGSVSQLLPSILEVVTFNGVLVLTSSDGRSPTGHDRIGAVRHLLASARAHPCSWEIALRLQMGVLARSAWAMGRDVEPLLQLTDGRAFHSAVRLRERFHPDSAAWVGLLARCDRCGSQQTQSLLRLSRWQSCACENSQASLAVSGPLWLGPLQDLGLCRRLLAIAEESRAEAEPATLRALERMAADQGLPPLCWSLGEVARRISSGPPALAALLDRLRTSGYRAVRSAITPSQFRTDAPWQEVLRSARSCAACKGGPQPSRPHGL